MPQQQPYFFLIKSIATIENLDLVCTYFWQWKFSFFCDKVSFKSLLIVIFFLGTSVHLITNIIWFIEHLNRFIIQLNGDYVGAGLIEYNNCQIRINSHGRITSKTCLMKVTDSDNKLSPTDYLPAFWGRSTGKLNEFQWMPLASKEKKHVFPLKVDLGLLAKFNLQRLNFIDFLIWVFNN